ncbi:MAG: hypothetical protein LBJ79_00895 [Endomicrobium sp.]|jgi:hypothetical protein|nr:hypothetical protein [Endomicrobium sp.]
MKILCSVIVFCVFLENVYALNLQGIPNAYDGSVPSANSMAMGDTGVTVCDPGSIFYYNSAILAYHTGLELQSSFSCLGKDDSHINNLYNPSGFGLTTVCLVKDDISISWNRLVNNNVLINISDNNYAKIQNSINSLSLSFGKKSYFGYSTGFSLSYLYGAIGETTFDALNNSNASIYNGNGFSCDLSFLFPLQNNLNFGLNLKNLIGLMFWQKYKTEYVPFTIMSGLGYTYRNLFLCFDWHKYCYRFGNLDKDKFHFGLEQCIFKNIFLRLGTITFTNFDKRNLSFTYGAGINIKNYQLSLSFKQENVYSEKFLKYMVTLKGSL